jgi:hypothetical protein
MMASKDCPMDDNKAAADDDDDDEIEIVAAVAGPSQISENVKHDDNDELMRKGTTTS